MKSLLKGVFCAALVLVFLYASINAAAADTENSAVNEFPHSGEYEEGEYVITEENGVFSLYRYYSGSPQPVSSSEELAALIAMCDGGAVTLDEITLDDALEAPTGKYTLRGSISFKEQFIIPCGADVTLDDLLIETESYIRVKGGSLAVSGGSITAGATGAVRVDYSSSSRLQVLSGYISSEGSTPTVRLDTGIVSISGGSIINTSGAAVESSSTLVLSGSPTVKGGVTDINASSPVSLSYGESEFSGELTLSWQGFFDDGNMYEIFRNASPEALESVKVKDSLGKEYPITYFEASPHTDETDFGAVYLPFELIFFDGGVKMLSQYYLKGEATVCPAADEKAGYIFDGWYADEQLTADFSFGAPITKNTEIFAGYRLRAPSFSLSSLSFTYDGASRTVSIDSLSHPLTGGFYTLEWLKDGVSLGTRESISVKNVSDSGEYACRITFSYGKDSVTVLTPPVKVEILKRAVELPAAQSKPYNGKIQYSDLKSTALYTVTDEGGIGAGDYQVMLTLKDPENYTFEAYGNIAYTVFSITRLANYWTSPPRVGDSFPTDPPSVEAHPAFGEVYYLYSATEDGVFTPQVPTVSGSYYCIARVDGCDDYSELVSEKLPFRILAELPIGMTLLSPPTVSDYVAFDSFCPAGIEVKVTYNSGREDVIGAGALGVRYQSGECFLYGDNAVTVTYLSLEMNVPVTVSKREYDVSAITLISEELTYDGSFHTLRYTGVLPVGLDGIPLRATVSAGGRDVGEYTVTLVFSSESRNYNLPDNKIAILKIMPIKAEILWENTMFVYDGTPKIPSAYYIDVFGSRIALTVSGAVVNAKENAVAIAHPEDKNYSFQDLSTTFTVKRAIMSFVQVVWSESCFSYDNKPHSVTVSGLPSGVSVIGYTDNSFTDAGSYTATALLSYDERNYETPPPLTHEWQITKISYDTSRFEFVPSSFVFDGNGHSPTLIGSLPIGLDGIPLEYSFSALPKDATFGAVTVSIIFSTKSKNYLTPEPVFSTVEITPMPISVEWSYDGATYDGKPHIPAASSPLTALSISGAMIDAGKYTAYCTSLDKNYTVENSDFVFEIKRAENKWLVSPSIEDVFASGTPSPCAAAAEGAVGFGFYTDPYLTDEVTLPLSAGVYYMVASVTGLRNYKDLVSSPMAFRVIEVVPESIEAVVVKKELIAFERICENDLSVCVIFNDGSIYRPTVSELNITYESGDSFRAKDKRLTVGYQGLNAVLDISVKRATLDLSLASWEGVYRIYDGTDAIPTLTGLPSGVEIKGYTGYGRDAGEYTVIAELAYDRENYELAVPPSVKVTVARAVIEPPTPADAIYSGAIQYPDLGSELLTTDFAGATNAGEYAVKVTARDRKNYCFGNSQEYATVIFRIAPMPVDISAVASLIYLWQSPTMPDITLITPGVDRSELDLYYEVDGDVMSILSGNPNYTVNGGRITLERTSRPSPDAVRVICTVIGALTLIALAGVALYVNRDRIKDLIAQKRCKRSFERDEQIKHLDEISVSSTQSDDVFSVNVERADALISDDLAKGLIKKERETVYTDGKRRYAINVDTVSDGFECGDTVDVNSLKEKGLVPRDTGYVKILARGSVDKPLSVKANAFSLSAVKMIALKGGEAIKVNTQAKRRSESRK